MEGMPATDVPSDRYGVPKTLALYHASQSDQNLPTLQDDRNLERARENCPTSFPPGIEIQRAATRG
jgi:hypothetical protein